MRRLVSIFLAASCAAACLAVSFLGLEDLALLGDLDDATVCLPPWRGLEPLWVSMALCAGAVAPVATPLADCAGSRPEYEAGDVVSSRKGGLEHCDAMQMWLHSTWGSVDRRDRE